MNRPRTLPTLQAYYEELHLVLERELVDEPSGVLSEVDAACHKLEAQLKGVPGGDALIEYARGYSFRLRQWNGRI